MAAPTTTNEVTVRRLSEVLVGSDGNGGIKKAVDDKIAAAINALDVTSTGGAGKYISAISETDGKISATATTMDTSPTASSTNAVTSGGVKTALDGKAASSHTHGNITNGGALQTTDVTIANGDKLVVTDASDSNKVARTSLAFDGSTTGQLLSKAGSFQYPKEAYLEWGGKNFTGSYGPIDAAMISELGANRFAFGKAAGIVVEYTRDGGTTWVDYGLTDAQKSAIFSTGQSIRIGKSDSTNNAIKVGTNNYKNYKVRVTITTNTFGVYSQLNKFVIYCSTSGSQGPKVTLSGRTRANVSAGTDTWSNFGTMTLGGWSGYNVLNTGYITTYGNQNSHFQQLRFLFEDTVAPTNADNEQYQGLSVSRILGFGGVGWQTPSTMASNGHLYAYDYAKNATFPANVTATSFTGSLTGNADTATKASYLTGFTSRHTSNISWGTLTPANGYTTVTEMRYTSGSQDPGAIAFGYKAGSGTSYELSCQIDGVFYQREGGKRVLDVSDINSSFYAPTGAGTSGQLLKSSGSGAPTWATANAALVGITVTSTSVSDGTNTFNKYTHPTTSGNKHVPSGGSSGQFLGWSADGTAAWVANPNTDTKVTSSANHYTPETASGSDKTASASGATAAWSIDVVKGVTLNTDGKGHVTGLSVTSGKIPGNPNTDTKQRIVASTAKTYLTGVTTAPTSSNQDLTGVASTKVYATDGVLTATSFSGNLTGNVTGNCSGSSGSCTGNAATATTASAVSTTGAGTADAARHIWFSDSATETKRVYNDSFKYNPVGNIVTANISGNAATATTATDYASSGGIATALAGKAASSHTHGKDVVGGSDYSIEIDNTSSSAPGWISVVEVNKNSSSYKSVLVRGKLIIGNGNWSQAYATEMEFQAILMATSPASSCLVATPIYVRTNGQGSGSTYSKASPSDFIRIARSASNNMELQVNFSAANFRYAVHYTVQSDSSYVANTTVKAGMSSPTALIAPTYDYCAGKVLGTGGSSSVPVYVDAQGVVQECDIRPDADVALIVYGDATYSSVKALYNAGKKLYLVTGGNIQPSGRFEYRIPLTLITYDANLEVNAFYFEQPQDDRAGASEVGSIAVYRLDSTGWTTTPKQVGYAVNAGSAVTYTSGGGIDTALQGKMSTSGNNATNAAGGNIIRSMNAWTVPEDSEMIAAASSTGQGKYTMMDLWDNYFKNKVNSIVPNVGYMGASAMTAMQKNGTDIMPGNNCKICLDPNTFNSFGYNGFICLGHYRPTGSGQKYYGWCGNFAQNGGIVEIDFDYTATVEIARSSITSLPTSLNVSFAAITEYNAFRYGFALNAPTIFATAQETMRFEVNWPNASTIQGHARLIGRGAAASTQIGTRIYVGAAQTSSNDHFLVLNVNNIRIKVTSGQIYDVTYS